MKNKILIFVTFVFVSLTAFASTSTILTKRYYNNYGDSFNFVERGVTFAVFQNGEFDFYINPRNDVHVGYQSRNLNISFNAGYNYDAYVQYDNYGAIIQVEDIPIYYDYYGRVDRIGNVNINYAHGRLARLGGMHIYYNNYGNYSHYSGYINVYNRNYVFHPYHNFFVRPFFEYRVVSYRPYRSNYRPIRYTYHRDHSRNKYYNNNNKRSNRNTRSRVATQQIPKRKTDKIARVDRTNRNTVRSGANTVNTRSTNSNATTRRNTSVENRTTRDNRSTTSNTNTRRNASVENRTTRDRGTITKRAPEKSVQNKRTATERKSVKVQERRTIASKNNTKSTQTRRSVNTEKKRATTSSRKPVKTEAKRTSSKRNSRS